MKGVLVHGPSGIGKSLLIKEVLSDMKIPTIVVQPKDLVGEEDKFQKIRNVFKVARN
jgi:AAA+ superfamily predicted ATPase